MTDPFDDLREPVRPVAPRPAFSADLRVRLARVLHAGSEELTELDESDEWTKRVPDQEVPAMTSTEPTHQAAAPATATPSLAPYLAVADARAAIRFYEEVFGARVDGPVYVADDGRVGHAELRIGDAVVMLADPWDMPGVADPTRLGATTTQLRLAVADVDATLERAVGAGASVARPPADQPYGERSGVVDDPFGHRWMLAAPLGEVPTDELVARMEEQGFTLVDGADVEEVDLGSRGLAGPASVTGTAAEPASLWYFTLGSPDVSGSVSFFRELFGWEVEPGPSGGQHIANITPPGGLARTTRADVALYFKVADFRGSLEKVRAMGGEVDEPVRYASGWMAACRDPHGVPFHVSEPAPGYE